MKINLILERSDNNSVDQGNTSDDINETILLYYILLKNIL